MDGAMRMKILSLLNKQDICRHMMVNPARSAPQGGCGVDNHMSADNNSVKQTKDHPDISGISAIR